MTTIPSWEAICIAISRRTIFLNFFCSQQIITGWNCIWARKMSLKAGKPYWTIFKNIFQKLPAKWGNSSCSGIPSRLSRILHSILSSVTPSHIYNSLLAFAFGNDLFIWFQTCSIRESMESLWKCGHISANLYRVTITSKETHSQLNIYFGLSNPLNQISPNELFMYQEENYSFW